VVGFGFGVPVVDGRLDTLADFTVGMDDGPSCIWVV
jgi:hypothetical protein